MPKKKPRPIVEAEIARDCPRLAAEIQAEHFRKRLNARFAAQRAWRETSGHLVHAWWRANHSEESDHESG
ncbi:MAG: hypothetical protein JXA14_23000 [Anaerolineae bacterium]|nr:hypothetical protein [Anaerolineae bacterium]